jgi:hypothetical protein
MSNNVPLPLQNIRIAFSRLGRDVNNSLHTQLGDNARLNEQKRLCLQFISDIRVVRNCIQIQI